MSNTTVRFIGGDGVLSVLEVHADEDAGMFEALAQRLFDLRVQVVRSEAYLTDGVVERLYVVEFDGAPIADARRRRIQEGVLEIVGVQRSHPPRIARSKPRVEAS